MNNTTAAVEAARPQRRFESIDQVRGAVMVLMALDHVRWFFTDISAYQPESLANTNLSLFFTRWVTHFCAPGFFVLAGMGILLYASKTHSAAKVRSYLLSRGLFLVVLELTIVGYSWVFTPGHSFGGVIWSLGCSFLLMALLVKIPRIWLLFASAGFLLLHNVLLDDIAAPDWGWRLLFWRALYQPGSTVIPGIADSYYFLFPIIPWLAMMVFGYSIAHYYLGDDSKRRQVFTLLGFAMIAAFIVLRFFGLYGNPDTLWISPVTSGHFSIQPEFAKTIISFLNTEKYPPSLQYTLMTLGPIFLWLGLTRIDQSRTGASWITSVFVLFGRVPLFFYICHLYLIHLLALVITTIAGQPNGWIAFGADPNASRPSGYGFDLPVVYLMWLIVITILYLICRRYADYKRNHAYAWLKYL